MSGSDSSRLDDVVACRVVVDIEPLVQLWQYDGKTCAMTPSDEPPPYWVVITDGSQTISRRTGGENAARFSPSTAWDAGHNESGCG